MSRLALALVLAFATGCGPRPPAPIVQLALERSGTDLLLRLDPAPGARINARVKPTLELSDGPRITFDAGLLTTDSAYFAEPPTARLALPGRRLRGTLRASVCPAGLAVCEAVTIPIDESVARP